MAADLAPYDVQPVSSCFESDWPLYCARKLDGGYLPAPNQAIADDVPYLLPPRVYQYFNSGVNSKGETKPNAQVLVLCEPDQVLDAGFIVHDDSNRTFYAFDSYTHYKSWRATTRKRTLHEVILQRPQKIKFDIDAEVDKLDALSSDVGDRTSKSRDIFDTIMRCICTVYEETYGGKLALDCVSVSDSTDASKFSRHIVLCGVCVANSHEASLFTTRVVGALPEQIRRMIDQSVNKTKQNFRLPGCYKNNTQRVKKVIWGTEDSMVITWVAGLACMPLICPPLQRIQATKVPAHLESTVIGLVAPYAEGLVFSEQQGDLYLYKREHTAHCKLCDRTHDKDNSLFASVRDNYVRVHCRRSGNSRVAGYLNPAKKEKVITPYGIIKTLVETNK